MLNPTKMAESWYSDAEIFEFLNRKPSFFDNANGRLPVPSDVQCRAFSAWLTNELRMAMVKGIQMANNDAESAICQIIRSVRGELNDQTQLPSESFGKIDMCLDLAIEKWRSAGNPYVL